MSAMNDDIAIVGFSFKLPQDVDDVSSFWDVLENKRNLMTEWPESRISNGSFEASKEGNVRCRGGHFITEDPGAFDAPFFSVTAKEAASMDPMQRWTLEASYHAFENAGIPAERLRGSRCGVFSASMTDDYKRMIAQDPDNVPRMAVTGTFASIIPNRVSWYFDLHGPSIHVDSACSSSLLALDLACQSLRAGEASSAIVTGSNLILGPTIYQMLSSLNFLSADSKCYSFDHRANGYARGEGVIALIIKPLSDAVRDGDMIRAVIRSTSSNQDGHTPGLTQPSPQAQEDLIRQVYKKANLPLDVTRYFEAHGTGTPVGDPIEMKAIGRVFRSSRSPEDPLYVGSVKANIGHLEGSSGLAGVLKSVLILEKGIIPANANFEKVNPKLDVDFYHTKVPSENTPWPSEGLRRASVNSFGFGGTNVHVILDDAFHYLQERDLAGNHCTTVSQSTTYKSHTLNRNGTNGTNGDSHSNGLVQTNGKTDGHSNGVEIQPTDGTSELLKLIRTISNGNVNGVANGHSNGTKPRQTNGVNGHHGSTSRVLVWSAADEKALKRMLEGYQAFFKNEIFNNSDKLDDLAFTLATRRSHMLWRAFAVVGSEPENQDVNLSVVKPIRSSTEAGVAFVFTGQGAQYASMGADLLKYPLFESTLQQIDDIYHSLGCEWSIFDELHNKQNIDRPEYSQPLSTAIQIGLIELLKSFGVVPKAVVGHSSGEIAAAYAIGALSLPAACKVSYFRGQLAGKLRATSSTPEAMMSVNIPEDEVHGFLESISANVAAQINIACINSPLNCTLSGQESALDIAKDKLDKDGIFAQKLKTGVAYHSPSMSKIADEYIRLMGSLDDGNPKGIRSSIPMVSSVTGKTIKPASLATAQYWVNNMVSPVRFADAIFVLTQKTSTLKMGMGNITDLIEVGAHPALRRPVQDTLTKAGNKNKQVRYSYVLHRSHSAVQTTLELLGQLFCHGHAVLIPSANQDATSPAPIPRRFLVDCPKYPFDHSKTYWSESRLSRDFRLREGVKGETLGARSFDWNPLDPRWRNFLSVETTPWIGDHVISGTVIYPAAGMLVMAMEAVQHMCPENRVISGYYVKEANFMNPILVKEAWEDRTETMLHLQPIKRPYEKESTWSDVTIYSYYDNRWTQCFKANIQVEYEDAALTDVQEERRQAHEKIKGQFDQAKELCTRPVDAGVFYEDATEHGLGYGEAFQVIEDIQWDGKAHAIARVNMAKWKTTSLIHPVVLDSAFHVLRVSTTLGLSLSNATNVPVRLVDGWFAPSGWQQPETSSVRYFATSEVKGGRESEEGSIYALADDGSVLCTMRRLITAAVSRKNEGDQAAKKLLYSIDWKPQLSLMEPQQLATAVDANTFVGDENTMLIHHQKLSYALDKVVAKTLKQLSGENRKKVIESQLRHMEWLEHHVKHLPEDRKAEDVSEAELEGLLQEIEEIHPPWKLHTTVVRRLTEILTGEVGSLEVIFDSTLADDFYADMFEHVCDDRLLKFLDLATHENPGLRILEVGAGTGGMTGRVIGALRQLEKQSGGLKFAEYTYTDVSPSFFEKATARWEELKERMTFKTFDMKRSAESQGFELGSYDLVIAGSVLHATEDLLAVMKNVRTTLKPTGHLLLLEVIAPQDVVTNFTFGLVPGWWGRREEWRGLSPCIPEKQWDDVLKWTGYSGNDLVLRDFQAEACHIFSIIVSKVAEEQPAIAGASTGPVLVIDGQSEQQTEIAKLINAGIVQSQNSQARIVSLDQIQMANINKEDTVICIAEMGKPFLATLSEERFKLLQKFLTRAQDLLWVSQTSINDKEYSQYGVMEGFLRSIRHEESDKHIVTLAIESQEETKDEYAQYIAKAYKSAFESGSAELEYIVRNGQLTTGRVAEDVSGNNTLRSLLYPQLQDKPFSEGPALKLAVGETGTLDSLQLVEDVAQQAELRPHEVEIEAKSWGLNFRDVLCALGRLEDNELGVDCAGVVTRVGPDSNIKPGDRVAMISIDCMRTHPRALDHAVIKIPNDLSFEAAASILVPGMTAYYSMIDIARVRKGEKVLIHSAAGSTGQMAIWMAKMKGAEVFATVGSEEKRKFLKETFGIPDDHIFNSRNTSFAQGVLRVTNGYGVDVVLNSISGDGLRATWECMAPFGRFVEIGVVDIKANSSLPMAGFARNVSYSAVDLRYVILQNPELTSELLKATIGLLTEGAVQHPGPLHLYPVSKAEQAFRYLQGGKNIGRIILNVDPSDVVPQLLVERRSWTFDANASYVIAGGSGGLGRAIMKWMADRGAKHFIVPSRSGSSKPVVAQVISELTKRGVNVVAPKCDVSSAESLAKVLEEYSSTMPPVKGCINAAMVLQDAVFDNMTYAQWDLTMKSKVDSALNLHELLPKDLDFFILLSSLNGVCGALAQSNYAGGCSFQDALARYRVAHGQKAASIDIGWMRNIGIVAETQQYQRQRKSWDDMQKIDDVELLALLTMLCDPSAPLPSQTASQVLFGLRTPADFLTKGQTPPSLLTRPLFAAFSHILGEAKSASKDAGVDSAAAFREAADTGDRIQIVIQALTQKLARSMAISPDDVELNKPLSSYGVDSLMAVELRNWIGRDFGAAVAVFDIMGNVPVAAIGDLVVAKSTVGKTQ
ncbi:hypothetical protein F4821DRAFT_164132 [Hypoxylon rubiginosum]|uniref:Uncharacterized protein n=1 Tax=Hypoxylon rubiginosum TaxID=110542 RepID=A0ACC0CWU5_9PEZI|nr:hypothetical protein F4821DRAFT_164132 [Hypoxylon rubiginosum]